MQFLGVVFLSLIAVVGLKVSESLAQGLSIIQGSDGTSGAITDLGNGFKIYSDSHGNRGTITDLGGGFQSYSFTTPQGQMKSGSITTFGTPAPPNNLTPAPILPFTPSGLPMPREQVAPVVPMTPMAPNSSYGNSGTSSGGRFGR